MTGALSTSELQSLLGCLEPRLELRGGVWRLRVRRGRCVIYAVRGADLAWVVDALVRWALAGCPERVVEVVDGDAEGEVARDG